ncbi:uncharacterized protein CCR75_009509 [Bremia lactucae]|uniref:DNA-directed DNA polymerase n=1 Tax=Bremia lactucae TaxID=4779 RepID=A0A976FFN1_BRELC|nr:hypothetical protein CCR75_009509 [Bremia lactucae]
MTDVRSVSDYSHQDEMEITLPPQLSRACYKLIEDYDEISFTEIGYLIMMSDDGRINLCHVRTRRYEDHTECTIKFTVNSYDLVPGMKCSFSKEFFASGLIADNGKGFDSQSYKVLVTERRLHIGRWICRARYYRPDEVYSCEFEYDSTESMSPGDWRWILNIIHSDFCHEESYAYVLPRDVHAQLRLTARPVKDVKMIPGSDNSYRVKVDGEHGWVFDAGSVCIVNAFNLSRPNDDGDVNMAWDDDYIYMRSSDVIFMIDRKRRRSLPDKNSPEVWTLKIGTNSIYGVFGASTSGLSCKLAAVAVTAIGRFLLSSLVELARENGFEVLCGDTDSVFIKRSSGSQANPVTFIDVYHDWAKQTPFETVRLEHDKTYSDLILVKPKIYYGKMAGKSDASAIMKGMASKRRDRPDIARDTLRIIIET